MRSVLLLATPFALIACTQVTSERETTFTYRGDTYPAVVRQYETGSGTFSKRVIFDGNRPVSCSATDDLDCAAAISYDRLDSND